MVSGNKDFRKSEFGQLIFNISCKDLKRSHSLISAIGYLIHDFKDRTLAKAIIFVDEKVSDDDEANGRTGKSLVGEGISKMTKVLRVDARNYSFTKDFSFQLVSPDTKVMHFDDAHITFQFEKLFSIITGDLTTERKYKDAMIIPYEDSPKFLISTNYVVRGAGSSYAARKYELEFSDHYSIDNTPDMEFGHRLFDDWPEEEWNKFDNLIILCSEIYIQNGLISYNHVNLRLRKLLAATSKDFIEFADSYINKEGEEYDKKEMHTNFIETYPEYDRKSGFSQRKLTSWLRAYATYYTLTYVERKSNGKSFIKLVPKNKQSD